MNNMTEGTNKDPDFSAPEMVGYLVPGVNLLGYARSSTDDQALSCPQQIKRIEKAWWRWGVLDGDTDLPRHHDPEIGLYVDHGTSGYLYKIDEREAGGELMTYCSANPQPSEKSGLIVIWSLARFARFEDGPDEAIAKLYELRGLGWHVRSLTDPGIDSVDDRYRLIRTIQIALTSEQDTAFSERISSNTRRAHEDQLEAGTWRGGAAPFGYQRVAVRSKEDAEEELGTLEPGQRNGYSGAVTLLKPDPVEAPYLRRLFRWYAEGCDDGRGMSLSGLADWLNNEGVHPEHGEGGQYHHTTVGKMLDNPAYVGYQVHPETGERHEARWVSLISDDLWHRVQTRRKNNTSRKGEQNSVYMLSGVLFCADCGGRYGGSTRTDEDLYYYRVTRRPAGVTSCEACRFRIRIEDIEQPLIQVLSEVHSHPKVQKAVRAEYEARQEGRDGLHARRAELKAALRETEAKIGRLLGMVESGGDVGEQAGVRAEKLNRRAEEIRAKLENMERTLNGEGAASEFADISLGFREHLEAAAEAERKQLVQMLVVRIEVDQTEGMATVHLCKLGR